MIVIMQATASARDVAAVANRMRELGLASEVGEAAERVVVSAAGGGAPLETDLFTALPGVDKVVPLAPAYRLAGRAAHPGPTLVRAGDAIIGGRAVAFMAGPCSVESRAQTLEVAGE